MRVRTVGESDVLPKQPGGVRRALRRFPRSVDAAIVVGYVLVSVFGMLGVVDTGSDPLFPEQSLQFSDILLMLLTIVVVPLALAVRRRFPVVGVFVALAAVVFGGEEHGFANVLATMVLLYSVPLYRSTRDAWLTFGTVFFVLAVQDFIFVGVQRSAEGATGIAEMFFDDSVGMSGVVQATLTTVLKTLALFAVMLLGVNSGNNQRYLAAVLAHAQQLARERDQRAQLAVAEERSRISRELHDVVAHSVTVMVALSEGAACALRDSPDDAVDALQRSAATGRAALSDMRRLLSGLDEPAAGEALDYAPQANLASLYDLLDGFREAGLTVEAEITRETLGDVNRERAVFRVVQESLTNVLRHAGVSARVRVTVVREQAALRVEVRDFGAHRADVLPDSGLGSGKGLQGISERVRVFGGSLIAGPVGGDNGGGWRVVAVFPDSVTVQKAADGDTTQSVRTPGAKGRDDV